MADIFPIISHILDPPVLSLDWRAKNSIQIILLYFCFFLFRATDTRLQSSITRCLLQQHILPFRKNIEKSKHRSDRMGSSSFPATTNKFKDHCILAFDGFHVVYTTNAEILEDYNKPRLIDYKGYNHMHLNGFVDVTSKAFLDVVIQPGQHPDERAAMRSMLSHFSPDEPEKYIITVDRGYESYDLIFQCELK